MDKLCENWSRTRLLSISIRRRTVWRSKRVKSSEPGQMRMSTWRSSAKKEIPARSLWKQQKARAISLSKVKSIASTWNSKISAKYVTMPLARRTENSFEHLWVDRSSTHRTQWQESRCRMVSRLDRNWSPHARRILQVKRWVFETLPKSQMDSSHPLYE